VTNYFKDDAADLINDLIASPSKAFLQALAEFEKQNLEISDADLTQYMFNAAVAFASRTLAAIAQLNPIIDKPNLVEAFGLKVLAEMASVSSFTDMAAGYNAGTVH
jgi:hypothetical protein